MCERANLAHLVLAPHRLFVLALHYGLFYSAWPTALQSSLCSQGEGACHSRLVSHLRQRELLGNRRSQRGAAALLGFAFCVFRISALNACTQAWFLLRLPPLKILRWTTNLPFVFWSSNPSVTSACFRTRALSSAPMIVLS